MFLALIIGISRDEWISEIILPIGWKHLPPRLSVAHKMLADFPKQIFGSTPIR
jgi:hypothetical protein